MTSVSASAQESVFVDRRQEQFPREPSYLVLPLPYSVPGVGSGLAVEGLAGKVAHTDLDLFAIQTFGAAPGTIVGWKNLYIADKFLFVDLDDGRIKRAQIQKFDRRGMNTRKSDFRILDLTDVQQFHARLTMTTWQRRLEIYAEYQSTLALVPRVRDDQGRIIAELEPVQKTDSRQMTGGMLLDLTDDHADPRRGVRLETQLTHSPRQSSSAPDTYIANVSVGAYIPFGRASTLALNAFKSDAYVASRGDTDVSRLEESLGYNCTAGNDDCAKAQADALAMQLAENRHGTATELGGTSHLRGYPGNRFFSAHAMVASAEYRWNFNDGFRPFNFGLWKDTAAALQLASFCEIGSVAEREGDLGKEKRSSFGAGFRMVSSSGMVYRVDIAHSVEGTTPILYFQYPW